MRESQTLQLADDPARRRYIAFINWGHAMDHLVMLIYPTVVIGLGAVYATSYAELIALSTASFAAFGIFSLPAGWLADHWSRRNMMAAFWFGCGASLLAAGLAPNLIWLAIALFALGVFAAIYHPVGMAMLIEASQARGRTLAFNGVCGNVGAALAAGIAATLTWALGWRSAFIVPAVVCIISGILYLRMVADDRHQTATRQSTPAVPLNTRLAATLFGLFMLVALAAGLTFNIISVAVPKIVDERLGNDVNLLAVGGLATAVFLCGAGAQLVVGRLVERIPAHVLLPIVVALQVIGIVWAANTSGSTLLVALAIAMAAIYGQVTVCDIVIARYTADAWRGRVYAVRYFLTFVTAGAAVAAIAFFYSRGGFDLVLAATAAVAASFFLATVAIAVLVSGAEGRHSRAAQPAE